MTESEERELDRWLERAGGEVNTWRTITQGTMFEARVRLRGEVVRVIESSRHAAIERLKLSYYLDPIDKALKAEALGRCAACPQNAVEEFKVRVYKTDATLSGITLFGPVVDHCPINGDSIHQETAPLCPRCMAVELRRFLVGVPGPASWLKHIRSAP